MPECVSLGVRAVDEPALLELELPPLEDGGVADSGQGLIAGFGPGITAEMALGTWVTRQPDAGPAGVGLPASAQAPVG